MDDLDRSLAEGAFLAALTLASTRAPDAPRRALALERLGRREEALAVCAEVLAAQPDHPLALLVACAAHEALRERTSALEAARRFRAAAPERAIGKTLVAGLGGLGFEAPLRGEVAALFDAYADTFEAHLVDLLHYRGHAATVAEAAARARGRAPGVVVDLGCGTGLCGPGLRPLARRLVGVDLSRGMLAEAAARGVYDALVEADLGGALATWPSASVDMFVAADVFGYVGELDGVFAEIARVLRPGGRLTFTAEATRKAPWELSPSRRVAYTAGYLRGQVDAAGLAVLRHDAVTLRHEDREAVPAWLLTVERLERP